MRPGTTAQKKMISRAQASIGDLQTPHFSGKTAFLRKTASPGKTTIHATFTIKMARCRKGFSREPPNAPARLQKPRFPEENRQNTAAAGNYV
jgi:hypothetical protein